MKRARLIIAEIKITKQGEIKNFQIKLPKNVKRIIAVETDIRMDSAGAAGFDSGIGVIITPVKK